MPRRLGDARTRSVDERIDSALDDLTAGGPRLAAAQLGHALVELSIDLIAQVVFAHQARVASPAVLAAISEHRQHAERPDWWDAAGLDPKWMSPRMRRAHRIAHSLDAEIDATIREATSRLDGVGSERIAFGRDFVVSMIAGYESVSATMLWLLLACALDRTLQDRLREVGAHDDPTQVVPARGATPGFADACLAEIMRLYPPLPLMFRCATEDDETPAGPIRAGTMVCISPWIVHRHRALWTEPDRFDVDRHLRADAELRAYMPFGVGARRCVGMHVGNHLVKAIARRILARFEISSSATRMPQPRAGMSLRPAMDFEVALRTRR